MPSEYGSTAIVCNVPVLTGYVVQGFTLSRTAGVDVQVKDENGRIVYNLIDDEIKEGTIEAVFDGATLPSVGATVTYDSVAYIVKGVDENYTNGDAKKVTLKVWKPQYLSIP